MLDGNALDFDKGDGFVTVVAQDDRTGAVLMVARADREAVERTIATGEMHYHSRTRGLWHKGETSGNVQRVVSLASDCDGDAVLARVVPAGPACHTGSESCFSARGSVGAPPIKKFAEHDEAVHHHSIAAAINATPDRLPNDPLDRLARTISARALARTVGARTLDAAPAAKSYTRTLLADRNLRLKKLGEETAELAVACADGDRERAIEEASDVFYHTLVALAALGASLDDVRAALASREH